MRINLYPAPAAGAGNFEPYLDTFLLEGATSPLGAVLILPGGGYYHRAYHEGDPVARRFNELGFHAFVAQYRVLPDPYPAAQRDAVRALQIIMEHAEEWRLDPARVAVLGFSAGGHLAACAGMTPELYAEPGTAVPRAAAMLLCYAVLSVTGTYTERNIDTGAKTPYRDAMDRDINPCELVNAATPPAFVWHTADDNAVPVPGSLRFAEAMWKQGKACELHIFPHAPHGTGLAIDRSDLASWPQEAAKFLNLHCGFPRGGKIFC